MADETTFKLRYVGSRFNGARLPVDVLLDLPAFRDLLVAFAKEEWRNANDRKRVPKGFDKSISFDLVDIEDGSAVPNLTWSRDTAQRSLPGFGDKLLEVIHGSFDSVVNLIDEAGHQRFPKSLSSEHIRALNRLGSGLRHDERIEFLGTKSADGNVIYLDSHRRKALITRVRETYQARFESIGHLCGSVANDDGSGHIVVSTKEHGEINIPVDADRVRDEFDGSIDAQVQLDLQIEMDNDDRLRSIVNVFDVGLIDAEIGEDLLRCSSRLSELQSLPPGWRDGNGLSISSNAIDVATRFIAKRPFLAKQYRIYPTEDGGILFEFETNGWDISVEFLPSGEIEMYGVKIDSDEELEPTKFANLESDFIAAFDRGVKG
ncbi:conserved hypothetical protein [Afipia carboxidovorans OM5]|nr:conserved hypothetical protein [Afipia carboxidovorans OM5]